MKYIVAVYELDLQYGGPEEGGWWYESGDLCRIMSVHKDEDAAYAAAWRINSLLSYRRRLSCQPGLSSMAYRGGQLEALVMDDYAPKHFPERRPHYE